MARNTPAPLLHHGPSQGQDGAHTARPREDHRPPRTNILLSSPSESYSSRFSLCRGHHSHRRGRDQHSPRRHDMANPARGRPLRGQATAERAGAGRAVNHKDPRGVIHLLPKTTKNQKRKNKYETSGVSQHSEFKYKKGVIRKQLKRQQNQRGHLQGGGPGAGASPAPALAGSEVSCHCRRWRPQSRSSASSSSKASLRPRGRVGGTCRTKVGRGEARQPGGGPLWG